MGDTEAVADLADQLVADHRRIHAVVHSAGGITAERRTTPQGLETTWASMVVGPRLLTRRLATDLVDGLGRAVWVTSGGMYLQDVDLYDLGWEARAWNGTRAYAQAKRAQVDLVAEASARGEAPLQVAVHPGWANTPGVTDALPGFDRVMGPILRTPEEGVRLAGVAGGDPPPSSLEPGALLPRPPRAGHGALAGDGHLHGRPGPAAARVDEQAEVAPYDAAPPSLGL